jgi:hypothetical protein
LDIASNILCLVTKRNAEGNVKLAVLIDAENISARVADALFKCVGELGEARIRRAYGDFSRSSLSSWDVACAQHALLPVQQFANASGKNAADIALVIDAMDLLHARTVEGVCLVTSDSDFTRLAMRIREGGLPVFGFGSPKTLPAFRHACTRHFPLEVLKCPTESVVNAVQDVADKGVKPATQTAAPKKTPKADKLWRAHPHNSFAALAIKAMSELVHTEGWIDLAAIGSRLKIVDPKFDCRVYGRPKLSSLFQACEAFDVDLPASGKMRIRPKPVSLPPQ